MFRQLFFIFGLIALTGPTSAQPPDFRADIRPILSDHCFACHGPDEQQRQADLRLDTAEGLASVVDLEDLDASELIARIESTDSELRMPPDDFHKPLTERQRSLLLSWALSGAISEQHWSFLPPTKSAAAPAETTAAVDYFLDRKILASGLKPNPIADRHALLRRVCFDLTGLPPSRDQMREFFADQSSLAYENLVDRLLASPAYGQHMGRYWLDLVRYGDTHGLHLDNYREMWPYRDWVIDAFNQNMPFNRFVSEQLAGDLLPDATMQQKIASGFNRLNVTTNEGGSIYEEVFARNVIDRTDAFGTVFLGLTTGCAVCHDHKFDPLTTHDYYSLSAFFNSLDGKAMDQNVKNPAPMLAVPTIQQQQLVDEFAAALDSVRQEMRGPIETVDAAQLAWEQRLINGRQPRTAVLIPTSVASEANVAMKVHEDGSVALTGSAAAKDTTTIESTLPTGVLWQTLCLEALVDSPTDRVGVSENGNAVLSEITIEVNDALSSDEWMPVLISHAIADIEQTDGPFAVAHAIDGKVSADDGWSVAGHQQAGGRSAWFSIPAILAEVNTKIRIQLKYQSKFARHQFRRVRLSVIDSPPTVPAEQQITVGETSIVGPFPIENTESGYTREFANEATAVHSEEPIVFADHEFRWQPRSDASAVGVIDLPIVDGRASATVLQVPLASPTAQSATLLLGSDDGHVVHLNGQRVGIQRGDRLLHPLEFEYNLQLKQGENKLTIKAVNHSGNSQLTFAFRSPAINPRGQLATLLEKPAQQRSSHEQDLIRSYFRRVACSHPDWFALLDTERGITRALEELTNSFATTLIWKELDEPRTAHVLVRGQYNQPGDEAPRGTPAFLPAISESAPPDRLTLAHWLCRPDHPLTSRVAVNRIWQQLFGTGIVRTSEDFGSQGEPPVHPELLDWLAVDLVQHDWDVKRLIRAIVQSNAYRRSANVDDAMIQADSKNRLLARGPRFRLDAEMLRDQALALAGLLNIDSGGPSVKPPQPAGLWHAVGYSASDTANFVADTDADKVYRRSVYIFWKRTSSPPQMSTFDAPSRESCTARRERTNTPMQALLLLNETQYIEASVGLAKRLLHQLDLADDNDRIGWLFETVTCRLPHDTESDELVGLLADMKETYQQNPHLAVALVGEPSFELAAWTVLASTLLNLDEVVNK